MKRTNDINGTSLVGYVTTTYDHIVKMLGEPHQVGDINDKVTAEWAFSLRGTVFTIYDYKEGHTPMGNYDWHVGGHGPMALELAREALGL